MQSINLIHEEVKEIQTHKNFNQKLQHLSNADVNANANAGVTAIALPVFSNRRAKNKILVKTYKASLMNNKILKQLSNNSNS